MSRKKVVLVVIGGLAVFLIRLYLAAQRLTYSIGGITQVKRLKGGLEFTQGFIVFNPTGTSIPINSAAIIASLNGFEVGTAVLKETKIIKTRTQTELQFTCVIPFSYILEIYGSINDVIKNKNVAIKFDGTIYAANIPIPFSEKFSYSLKTLGL